MEKFKHFSEQKTVRILALVLCDILLVNLAQFMALFIRFEFEVTSVLESEYMDYLISFAPMYTVMCLVVFAMMKLYNSLWKYISVKEAVLIGQAAVTVGVLQYFFMSMLEMRMPRSFPVLNILFLTMMLGVERFSYRFIRSVLHGRVLARTQQRTMLIGAGEAGAAVLRELNSSERSHNRIVCVIDDQPQKKGMRISGVPIVGGREEIARAAKYYQISEIIFAIPSCGSDDRREILRLCQQTGCITKTLPGLAEIANGEVKIETLRKVRIEDLLGRDSVKVDMAQIAGYIQGKTVLVTGGGGSIGSELCRQIAARSPRRLIIFDIYENNAYSIQQELRSRYPELDLVVLIGSVRDAARVEQLFEQQKPDIVYHAAAHKHVPLMEDSPNEAVKNNVFGTYHVAEAAGRHGVDTFVLISTDKAVNPTNIMGATKRVCEMIVQMFSRRCPGTRYVAVRFGNVLGSNGSVIPLFRRQIENGGPVTVTHRDVIRYFMTIPEAVSLVMQAGAYARGGEIFVLDMGSPVRIDDLARNMIRLSGYEPDVDIKVVYTGLRPGEKLFEELLLQEEGLDKTANDLIFVGHLGGFSDEELSVALERLRELCRENSPNIGAELAALVTTYHPERAGV